MDPKNKRVYVAMSGGVDSSAAAALLQREGWEVHGVFIKAWYPDWLPCPWKEERRDAVRVAATLGISFETYDAGDVYKQEVINSLLAEYKAGRTPNPDVMCNAHVKFGAFFSWARARGARAIATGHYARREKHNDHYHLIAGCDKDKDQSYFLWTVSQKTLAQTLFPIGAMYKSDVRAYAKERGLPVAEKKDSQGLCFLGAIDMRAFLQHYITTEQGAVLDATGRCIGTHDGALLYTMGQRHGFHVDVQAPDIGPHYVIAKDITANTITVAQNYRQDTSLGTTCVVLTKTNWIAEKPPEGKCQARIRYRQSLQICTIEKQTVTFETPQYGVAAGQSVVLYDGDVCLGGGVIEHFF